MRGEVTSGCTILVVMKRVGIIGAWVVVLFMTATLVETVGMVVVVVELGKAGRPAVVPISRVDRKERSFRFHPRSFF